MLFCFPLMAAIQEISARIGRVTGQGIAGNIRAHYSPWGDVPRNVENGGAALLALSGRLGVLISTRGKQRHEEAYHIYGDSHACAEDRGAGEHVGEFRAILPGGGGRDAERNDGSGRRGGLRRASCADEGRRAHRWGRTKGKIGFHGGKIEVERPRVSRFRRRGTHAAKLGERGRRKLAWRMGDEPDADQRLDAQIQAVGPPARGDVPASDGAGLSKSATSRRFVALSAARMKEWMETRLDHLDLLVIQIDGIHMAEDMLLVAAVGVDATGEKHPLGLVEGATENAATARALIANLIDRGLDRPCDACSSSMGRRRCRRRSGAPSGATR